MKTFINVVAVITLAAPGAFGQDTLKIQPMTSAQEQLQHIDANEIPDAITDKLSGNAYLGWTLENTYKAPYEGEADSVYYVLELRKGDETIRVWFDEKGKKRNDR